jgi:thimet oligopeptidase
MKKSFRQLLVVFVAVFLVSARTMAPDTPPPRSSHNPLMPDPGELFDFARVNVDAIKSASMYTENKVSMLLSAIGGVNDKDRTFANTMLQLDEVYNTLQKATSVYELIAATSTDKAIRDLAGEMQGKFNTRTDELLQNEALYKAVLAYSATRDAEQLQGERAFFLKKMLRQFELNGMNLPVASRDTLKSINSTLNALSVEFGKNISGDKTKVSFSASELRGLPDDFVKSFESKAGSGQYAFDLSTPTYTTFMNQCWNTDSRKKMYLAKMNVGGAANEKLLVQILSLRTRKAKLLGFASYAEYATADIMAQTTANVWKFENGLAEDLRPKAQKDLSLLLQVKSKYEGTAATTIYPYESAFYTTMLLKEKYNVDQEKVKEYFEMNNVIQGIFSVYQKLYNVRFAEDTKPSAWFKDVKAYSVYDNATDKRIGYFYLDLYPRPDKYNHFGCFSLTGSKRFADGTEQLRSAALVCNFPPPSDGKPSLLPHNTVTTFFHEFGHLIHVLLSNTELAAFAGTNVATDFVEAPSQIMENWAWQPGVLALFARHYQTGKLIPDTLVEHMIAARNLNSGLNMLQQVYYGTLDFTLNDNPPPVDAKEIVVLNASLQNKITFFPYVEGSHFAGTFGHLTGYGSKYYGYLWSLVYAADMFSEFQRTDPLSPETGARYREQVLSKGGSDDALSLVTNFLGREPNNSAFMRQIGLN